MREPLRKIGNADIGVFALGLPLSKSLVAVGKRGSPWTDEWGTIDRFSAGSRRRSPSRAAYRDTPRPSRRRPGHPQLELTTTGERILCESSGWYILERPGTGVRGR